MERDEEGVGGECDEGGEGSVMSEKEGKWRGSKATTKRGKERRGEERIRGSD